MGDTLEKLARDEKFMKNMSQMFSQSLDMKSQLEKQLEKYLKNINMPTRDDLQRMLTYLQRIEEKLLDLEDRLDVMASGKAGNPVDACSCADDEDCGCPEVPSHKRQPAGFTNGKKLKNQGSAKRSVAPVKKPAKSGSAKGKARR